MTMKIGNIEIKTPIFLAPMSGYTNQPFRRLCKQFGAGVVYTEFTNAIGIIRENDKTLRTLFFTEEERPIGIQIFGNDADNLARSALYIQENFSPDFIDINFGCPSPKVTKKGGGSAILKDVNKVRKIIEKVVHVVDLPVTVKMRSGWDHDSIIYRDVAMAVEFAGVRAVTLHPRTTKQMFKGKANWDHIAEIKEQLSIPVIGNGDIHCADDIHKMFEQTGCDGVMIGRAAIRKPWIFSEYLASLGKMEWKLSTREEIFAIIQQHIEYAKEHLGDRVGGRALRPHIIHYLKGFPGASDFRRKISKLQNASEIAKFFQDVSNFLENRDK